MIAVIFELEPKIEQTGNYFDIADRLRPLLIDMDGFISIERFQSLSRSNRYLSLSFWRDEESVQKWRNQELHRQAQAEGRNEIFSHYRLRVASVTRDYSMENREQVPEDSKQCFTIKHT